VPTTRCRSRDRSCLPLLADQGCQVTALIGCDDADGPRMSRRHGRDSTAQDVAGGLVLLLMANGALCPGHYRAAAQGSIRRGRRGRWLDRKMQALLEHLGLAVPDVLLTG